MKIAADHPAHLAHSQTQRARGVEGTAAADRPSTVAGTGGGEEPAVRVTLSPEAQAVLAASAGKSSESVANRARTALQSDEFASLRDQPFGRVASTLARGESLESLLSPSADEAPATDASREAAAPPTEEPAEEGDAQASTADLAAQPPAEDLLFVGIDEQA